jgi:phosphoribosylformylglycinamidine cyclo-ligase
MATDCYKQAGVDLEAANELVVRIKPLAKATFQAGVMSGVGQSGALYSLANLDYEKPVLVSSADGVGTKLKVAFLANRHNTVGIDLVAMNVNDILVQGARPLFFLDYIATGRLNLDLVTVIVSGIAEGCRQARCSLVGGETAEMPDFYRENEYDLAGFAVGIVERDRIIDGSDIRVGDQIVGLASDGLHSNGYSLARRIVFQELGLSPEEIIPECGSTVADELLRPTRIYSEAVQVILRDFRVSGMAHITGGGVYDKVARVLPGPCQARIQRGSWDVPPIFRFLQEHGRLSEGEMHRVFNNGIGFVLIVPAATMVDIMELLHGLGQRAYHIGSIHGREPQEPSVVLA